LKPVTPVPQTTARRVEPVKPKESKNAALIKQYISNGDKFKSEGNLSAAKGEYNKAKGLIEQSGEEVLRLAEVNRSIQSLSEAEKREASIRSPGRVGQEPKSKEIKVKSKVDVQKPDRGRVEDASAVETRPSAVDTLLEEGKRLYFAEKFEEAKGKFSAVLQLETSHPTALQRLKEIDYSVGIRNLNLGIKSYFEGERPESEESLRKAVQALSKEKKYEKKLVSAYLFLAVVLLENHYIGEDPSGKLLQEAGEYITKIKTIDPGFELEEKYFSPKVVKIFSQKK
jgi:tetratricopeptide (TPR) repeat protein